jgi:hypothetical protein
MPAIHRLPKIVTAFCLAGALFITASILAGAWSEEELPFIDPYTGEVYTATTVSSIHFDLQYALNICAGFSITDARRIQVTAQLVDSGEVGPYSICSGSLPETPAARDVCGLPLNTVFPASDQIEGPGCFTSRFGTFSPFFHFPRDNPQELGALRAWAFGESTILTGYAAFAFGGVQVVEARCTLTPTTVIDTGDVAAGSLDAFAIYLHSLGDSWSHKDCIAALDAAGEPWGTHTNEYDACNFTAHHREFGSADNDTNRTEAGVRAIYQELKTRSLAREGQYLPVQESANNGWLDSQITAFVHNWDWDGAEERRLLAATVASSCRAMQTSDPAYQRAPQHRYLPLIVMQI